MRALIFAFFLLVMAMTPAQAACTLTGLQPSGSTIINAGTYTGSTLTFAVSLSFRVTTTGTGGTCAGSVAFRGTATSPQMTDTNGNKLNYSLLGYYSTTPGARGTFSVTNPNTGSLTFTLNSTLTIAAGQSAATGAPNGVYQDLTVSLVLFPSATSTTVVGTLPLTITARVATPTTCTIAGSASGGTRNLDFSNGRTISTSTQTANFGSVTCNSPTTLTLTSSNGGVKSAATAPVNYTNLFDYVATTTVNSGTVTLNTSTVTTAAGSETATGRITALTTTNAALAINVTPIASAKPLVAGTYSDVLTLTITPD